MDSRREFLKNASMIAGGAGLLNMLPPSIAKALAIDPAPGSSFLDAEHIVFLMQENRSFDHAYGSLQGVRGFNDPRAIQLPNKNLVWLQTDKTGNTYCPFRLDIHNTKATWMSALPHSWADQVDARNEGLYDRWLHAKPSGRKEYSGMPLTLGFHTREDLPFYYAFADAFTVCDHNFCSSLTGTTPNRLYFWSGTIRGSQQPETIARVWNGDADYDTPVSWTTFPERLEANGIGWKVYQNELSVDTGLKGEAESWLANFTDNPLEFFSQYHVKFHPAYISNIPKAIEEAPEKIQSLEEQLSAQSEGSEEYTKTKKQLAWWQHKLEELKQDKEIYTTEKFNQLPEAVKAIHRKAFATNLSDPDYHSITELQYQDGDQVRKMNIPKGDVLHQFREDVNKGKLPTVSWIVAPENFSDHPSSAWFGVWYISEVLDILTKDPEIWKKTIFILTYDENDGYFDHLPPFVAPHPHKKGTGKTSSDIAAALEYVAGPAEQSSKENNMRISPIGLGYRVPMVIASPWSRGGWVNSEIFDHTSSLQFLERFLSHKTGKKITEPNISQWRRTVCGDLSSAFRPFYGEAIELPKPVDRDLFVSGIHKAQFKKLPDNFKALSAGEIEDINNNPLQAAWMPQQEKGIRPACSLPYELYAAIKPGSNGQSIGIQLKAGKSIFGAAAAGAAFNIYALNLQKEGMHCRSYAVSAGHSIEDEWPLGEFVRQQYHLKVYGPNGYFREYQGNANDPQLSIACHYENGNTLHSLSGNIRLDLVNHSKNILNIRITDNAYKTAARSFTVKPGKTTSSVVIDTSKHFGWYDFTVSIKGYENYSGRFAGRVENGKPGKTDPFMGRMI